MGVDGHWKERQVGTQCSDLESFLLQLFYITSLQTSPTAFCSLEESNANFVTYFAGARLPWKACGEIWVYYTNGKYYHPKGMENLFSSLLDGLTWWVETTTLLGLLATWLGRVSIKLKQEIVIPALQQNGNWPGLLYAAVGYIIKIL